MIALRTAIVGVLPQVLLLALTFATMEAETSPLPEPPQVRGQNHIVSLTLRAVRDAGGKHTFEFEGQTIAPVIRVEPGDLLKITYVNNLPAKSDEECALGPCMNMSNLHFHGMAVSPQTPQDNVITMLAMPGETLHYAVRIPKDHPPGLFWYHPHPHGESQRQVLDGMSGAIVVEGIERYVPEVQRLRERILVLRGPSIENDANAARLRQLLGIAGRGCGAGPQEAAERIFTINGEVRPQIDIAPGERQFWRMVNASADRYLDLQLDGQPLEVVAMDGVPLALHDPDHPTQRASHFLLPPAGRLEAIVTGPPEGVHRVLRTRCVDTGTAGDPNPEMVLADIVAGHRKVAALPPAAAAAARSHQNADVEAKKKSVPDFLLTFTEDKNGFYINGEKFAPDAKPMVHARVGTYQHWRIVNRSDELHPFHIHQVHFLTYAVNGMQLANPQWLDTVNVPYRGTVDVIMDFTNPVISGMSLFHCHLLNHEDKGMMAKIAFE
jgi:FtsP/CotA-like multicopper oxidase with cupredoxin domain